VSTQSILKSLSKLLLLSLFSFSIFNHSFAQHSQKISGKLLDKESKEPLVGGIVSILSTIDSTELYITNTNQDGEFIFSEISNRNCIIKASFIGYKNTYLSNMDSILITPLIAIYLEKGEVFLNEVEILEQQSLKDIEKRVYKVSDDLLGIQNSATDVLQNTPSVTVDIDGKILLRNSADITFFLNGKPSAMLQKNASTMLSQMPAAVIEQIEIISNPSAKYRAEGSAGIVNIVTKDNSSKGVSGIINANLGTEKRYNATTGLMFNLGPLEISLDYSLRNNAGGFIGRDERYYKSNGHINSSYLDKNSSVINYLSHSFYSGLSFPIGEKNMIDLGYGLYTNSGNSEVNSTVFQNDSLNNIILQLQNSQIDISKDIGYDYSLGYQHVFNEDKEHTLLIQNSISSFKDQYDIVFNQNYQEPNIANEISENLQESTLFYLQTQADYLLTINSNNVFEGGLVAESVDEKIVIDYQAIKTEFQFKQQILAAYLTHTLKIAKWSAKGGLRIEQTKVNRNSLSTNPLQYQSDYSSFFPSASIKYELDKKKESYLSYSKRIQRPESFETNPNDNLDDPRNIYSGNISLNPVFTHYFEWAFNYNTNRKSLLSTFYVRLSENEISEINSNRGDSVVIYGLINLNNRKSFGSELNYNIKSSSKFNYNLTGNVFYTSINAQAAGFNSIQSALSGNVKANTQIKFGKTNTIQVNAFYYFPEIYPQGRRKAMYYGNIAYQKGLFKNKVQLNTSLTDALYTFQYKSLFNSAELDQYDFQKRRFPVFYIGFIWKFNQYQAPDMMNYEFENLGK
jgi:hypothetical protein